MAKQEQRRASRSKLGFVDVRTGVEISRKLQTKILQLLENPEESPITPMQIDAVTRYLDKNGLLLADLMAERNRSQGEAGDGFDEEDEEPNSRTTRKPSGVATERGFVLPFTTDQYGNSIPNPRFKPEEPPARSTAFTPSKRLGDSDLV